MAAKKKAAKKTAAKPPKKRTEFFRGTERPMTLYRVMAPIPKSPNGGLDFSHYPEGVPDDGEWMVYEDGKWVPCKRPEGVKHTKNTANVGA